MTSGSARSGGGLRSRIRHVGATGTAALLLGTTALAPFSMATAFAEPGASAAPPAPEPAAAGSAQTLAVAEGAEGSPNALVEIGAAESRPAARSDRGGSAPGSSPALYSLEQFLFSGAITWSGYRFTYYSERVLPGAGLDIPGRHISAGGYVSDAEGFIVLAGDAPKGTVFDTPFGARGKIYDRGTVGTHLDVYIR